MTKDEKDCEGEVAEPSDNPAHPYDLEERTAAFGKAVIVFAQGIPWNVGTWSWISELVRSATSVGANYVEADDAESKKDFRHKISICEREARETKHWLKMLVALDPSLMDAVRPLWQEANELHLIFASI